MSIDWFSAHSQILMNPLASENDHERVKGLKNFFTSLPGHFWLATSGSRAPKWVGLSKEAILVSARAVNSHLGANREDHWIQALPLFHVGGLSIWARAFLNGARVSDFRSANHGKWNAEDFYNYTVEHEGTLTALVPAQLYDLMALNKPAPISLRAIIIGGGALSQIHYEKAIQMGWPILPSYGLTECSSQVATAFPQEGSLKLLSHIQMREIEGRLWIKSSALLTTYAIEVDETWVLSDPKVDGWFPTDDQGILNENNLILKGRIDNRIKIGGESVDFELLEERLQMLRSELQIKSDMTLIDMDDDRLGRVIHLATESCNESQLQLLLNRFHLQVLPFEKIRRIYLLDRIPRSALCKVLKNELRKKCVENFQ